MTDLTGEAEEQAAFEFHSCSQILQINTCPKKAFETTQSSYSS